MSGDYRLTLVSVSRALHKSIKYYIYIYISYTRATESNDLGVRRRDPESERLTSPDIA